MATSKEELKSLISELVQVVKNIATTSHGKKATSNSNENHGIQLHPYDKNNEEWKKSSGPDGTKKCTLMFLNCIGPNTDLYLTRRRECTYFACQKAVQMSTFCAASFSPRLPATDSGRQSISRKRTGCSILSCRNCTRKGDPNNGHVSFHKFPSNPNIKEKWMEATGQRNWFPTKK